MKTLLLFLLIGCGGSYCCTGDKCTLESDGKCTVTYCNRYSDPTHAQCIEWKTQPTWCRQ